MQVRFLRVPPQAVIPAALTLLFAAWAVQPASAGTWQMVITSYTVTLTANGVNVPPSYTINTPTAPSGSTGLPTEGVNITSTSGAVSASRSATITVTWVPNPALQSDPAPTASVNVFASAGAGGPIGSSASADDGFGDQEVSDPGRVPVEEDSTGTHLIPVTNGSATVTVNETASCTGSSASPEVFGAGLNGVSITVDSRTVAINSGLGSTYHKDPVSPDPAHPTGRILNVPYSSTSELHEDTLYNSETSNGYYNAVVTGPWGASSSFLWHSVLGVPETAFPFSSGSGTFTLPGDPILTYSVDYSDDGGVTAPAYDATVQDHVYLHLTDSVDGANATANDYVTFHNAAENWAVVSLADPGPTVIGTSDTYTGGQGTSATIDVASNDTESYDTSIFAGGAMAVVGATAYVLDPPAWLIGLLTAGGYTLGVTAAPDPTPLNEPIGDEIQWNSDLDTEMDIILGIPSGFMASTDRIDETKALAADTDSTEHADYWGGPGVASHTLTYTVTAYQNRTLKNMAGDSYGSDGYDGPVTGTVTIPVAGSTPTLYQWTVDGVAP